MSPRPIRVAHLVATAGRSGVESHLRAALPAFDRTQVEARLFVPGEGPLVDALRARPRHIPQMRRILDKHGPEAAAFTAASSMKRRCRSIADRP